MVAVELVLVLVILLLALVVLWIWQIVLFEILFVKRSSKCRKHGKTKKG
jgi:hypothetical protein